MRSFPYGMAVVALSIVATPAMAEPDTDRSVPHGHRAQPHPKHAAHAADTDDRQHGNASFYAKHFTGRRTASGAAYDPGAMTAAHRTLPMGTQVKVTNPKNDRSVVVTVNDRGPVPKNRVIDVSSAAASKLGMTRAGVTPVETEVVGKGDVVKAETR